MPWEKEAFSAVIFPQFSYFFSNGFEAELGGLVALGRDYTRFGDPVVGLHWSGRGSELDTRCRSPAFGEFQATQGLQRGCRSPSSWHPKA